MVDAFFNTPITNKRSQPQSPPAENVERERERERERRKRKALLEYVVVSSPQYCEKYSLFIRFSPWRAPRPRHFAGYPFGASRKKHQPFSITQPKEKNLYFHHTMKMKQSYSMAAPKKKDLSRVPLLQKHRYGSPIPRIFKGFRPYRGIDYSLL